MRLKEFKKLIMFHAFNYSLEIVFTNSMNKSCIKRNLDGDDKCDGIFNYGDDNNHPIILFHMGSDIGTFAHEAYHAIKQIMVHISAEHEEEIIAYHIGYLVQHVYEFRQKIQEKLDANNTRA